MSDESDKVPEPPVTLRWNASRSRLLLLLIHGGLIVYFAGSRIPAYFKDWNLVSTLEDRIPIIAGGAAWGFVCLTMSAMVILCLITLPRKSCGSDSLHLFYRVLPYELILILLINLIREDSRIILAALIINLAILIKPVFADPSAQATPSDVPDG